MFDFPTAVHEFLSQHSWIGGAMLAILTSVLRVVYDQEETRPLRIFLESAICGSITVTFGSALVAMGYDQSWYLFIGGSVGFMGSQWIRALANRLINKKIGEE